ncbi:MAG: transketolase [Pseudobacteriovorax sp.]|nr:transketolase [Pseudobacteriovorax sp.]
MSDNQAINVLKGLVIDGVNRAKSGHPGGAMSSMDFAYLLFTEYMRFNPDDPNWLGRDRFILSAGHESMLLYSLFHQMDWLKTEDLAQFRQLHSKTPGHPENFMTPGVECTTGPLGQGAAMSVGFAIASLHLAAKMESDLFHNRCWVLMGDGCMQEGVTLGAASMAGHLQLSNLIWFYDRNKIQISGKIDRSVSDDYEQIFKGFGWDVASIDGHSHEQIRTTLDQVNSPRTKPLLIIGDTTMAKGSANMEGSHKTHGSPLPADERLATKKNLGLNDEEFFAPAEIKAHFQRNFDARREEVKQWGTELETLLSDAGKKAAFQSYFENDYKELPRKNWNAGDQIATRNAFGEVIENWADQVPSLVGGSADLEPSNMTGAFAAKVGDFNREDRGGRNFAFGVREFPMSAVCNGIALHGGLVPFDATFLSFADYSRPALRLGAIQKVRVIHEFTHDSFYLGEDGPTHQPVEHVMSLRSIPDFLVIRPADARETQVLMEVAVQDKARPSAICLSRQKLPVLDQSEENLELAKKGAYIVRDVQDPEVIIMATGGEVSLALEAAEKLSQRARVVSMPCWELFDEQDDGYKASILPANITKRVSIEAGVTLGWQRFTGDRGLNIGLDHYGASAPAGDLAKEYGFTAPQVTTRIEDWLKSL